MEGKRAYEVAVERDVPMRMRDGVVLYADVYSPVGPGKFPALLVRLPYDKSHGQVDTFMAPEWYARNGYIVVMQDTRGRFKSGGDFRPYHFERQDGLDTLQYVKSLSRGNGRIGMYGSSYVGATQLQAAVESPPGLTAIAPAFTNDGFYEDWTYKNGALKLAFVQAWSAFLTIGQTIRRARPEEISEALAGFNSIADSYSHLPQNDHPKIDRELGSYYYEWLEHPTFDEYWGKWHLGDMTAFSTPALHFGGWYDVFLEGTLRNFTRLTSQPGDRRVRDAQKLVLGPWCHTPWASLTGDLDFGPEAGNIVNDLQVRWFDHWLRGADDGFMGEPPVTIFVMGENRWRGEEGWPLARTVYKSFYIHSGGRANSATGDGWLDAVSPREEREDIYVYNPYDPVPSVGGHSCCFAALTPMGPKDQRFVETRNDVLVYRSAPLKEDLEITGPVEAVVFAASTANDTDFTVKLVDVYPDGRVINLIEGIQRASFRDGNRDPSPISPGRVYEYRFQIGCTSNLFRKAHRFGVEISSSNFPAFDRNLNLFHLSRGATYLDARNATQKIHHNAEHPTHLILPVIPR